MIPAMTLKLRLPFHFIGWLSALLLTQVATAGATLEIKPLPESKVGRTIPWVKTADTSWKGGEPTFQIEAGPDKASAKGWAALDEQAFLLRVEVKDAQHFNGKTGPNLWDGDSLQIAIDGLGDGSRGMDRDARGPFGRDDLALGLALTQTGPEGWMFVRHRSAGKSGPLPKPAFDVTREGEVTRYELRLPWEMFGMMPGISPSIGLAVQVNDTTPGETGQARGYFGRGADGIPRAGLHETLTLGPEPGAVAAHALLNNAAWNAKLPGRVRIALKAGQPLTVEARLGSEFQKTQVPADGRIHRVEILARPAEDGTKLAITVRTPDGNVVLENQATLRVPQAALDQLLSRIDGKLAAAPHPLFARHLQSVRSLVLAEWARLGLYLETDPLTAERTLERIRGIEAGLRADSGEWAAYLDGRRTLVMAFISPHDATLQHYLLTLPKDWDPEKSYPLFFELHGAGDANPLAGPASQLGVDPEAPQLHGYESPKTFASIQRHGYHVQPWGRGNLGYRGIAEIDVLEAYDDVHANFKIDETRRYLYGFSMGGGGTWSIGLRTPDRWAALAILAGASRRDPPGSRLAENAAHLPVWIWCGEEDRLFPDMQRMIREFEAAGIKPVTSSTPGLGHNYIMAKQEEAVNWLQQFTRRRPDRFTYRADTDSQTGAWGIRMERNPAMSGMPVFKCSIDGQTVTLESEGTPGLTVDPGPAGLGLAGSIKLIWNGKPVYEGEATKLRLRDGKAQTTN